MKTVRMVRTGHHPIIDSLFEPVRDRFAAAEQYELLEDGTEHADVVLAFMPSTDDLETLEFERQSYQDFIGLFFIEEPVDSDAKRVVRSYELGLQVMANLAGYIESQGDGRHDYKMTLITPERGHELIEGSPDTGEELFDTLVRRSDVTYVDDNVVHTDLPEELWEGDEITRKMQEMARRLDSVDLVPSAVPLDDLSERTKRRFFKVLGLRQVSYGNMSARRPGDGFWMTGRGVDKTNLQVVGRDIILVDRFDKASRQVHVRVPPGHEDARVSIDSSIHAVIYESFPEIGAMIHIHSFVDDIVYTDDHYPCGTVELCESTLEGLKETPDPNRTILGLTNHGILVTGADLEDSWSQIEARLAEMEPAGA